MLWLVNYYARGAYRNKYVEAPTASKALKKARIKNVKELLIVTDSKELADAKPSEYVYVAKGAIA